MRITIVQTEIEEAIRNHILSQISVQEDMEIDINLRATRGAEGYQADIDIHPKREGPKSTPPAPKGGSSSEKPLKIEETVTSAKASKGSKSSAPKAQVVQPPVATKVEEEPPVEATEEPKADTEVEPKGEATETETETPKVASIFGQKKVEAEQPEAEQPAATERKSLFGDLKRPVNAANA